MGRWRSGQSQQTVNLPTSVFGGSNPSLPTVLAVVAQSVEHLHGKEKVTGPIPVNGSDNSNPIKSNG